MAISCLDENFLTLVKLWSHMREQGEREMFRNVSREISAATFISRSSVLDLQGSSDDVARTLGG